jgi:hypothetical protein
MNLQVLPFPSTPAEAAMPQTLQAPTESEHPKEKPTKKEASEITRLDGIVRKSLATIKGRDTAFADLGDALRCFREQRLYRFTHDTFRDYCRKIWGFTDRWARDLILAAEVFKGLAEEKWNRGSTENTPANIEAIAPASAKAAVALAEAPKEEHREILQAVAANGEVTAPAVKKEIARRTHRRLNGDAKTAIEAATSSRELHRAKARARWAQANAKSRSNNGKPSSYLSAYDQWQSQRVSRWQREFGARAWRAYNAQVFAILREVREWWEGKLGA